MKALYKSDSQPGLEMTDVPDPKCGHHDVIVRVITTGLCGTDLHILDYDEAARAMVTLPLVPGHEFYGEVVEVGQLCSHVAVGDRVSGEGHVVCGMCRNCRAGRQQMCIKTSSLGVQRDGAFAEYVTVPETNIWVHREDYICDTLGALFDPFGNAVHTALAFPVVGEDVLITGAGPIGLMAAAVARHAGARKIVLTDVSAERLKLAEGLDVDLVLDVSQNRIEAAQDALGMEEGFDVGLEMSGNGRALQEMVENMNHGGSIALLGLPSGPTDFSWTRVVTRMLTLKGIYGREMYESWYAMSAMLQTNPRLRQEVSGIATHRFQARDWAEAFRTAGARTSGKVLLDWTSVAA